MCGDNAASSVSARPSPELLNRVGHNLMLTIAASHSAPLQAAAVALERLAALLPDARCHSKRQVGCGADVTDDRAAIAYSTHRSERGRRSTTSTGHTPRTGQQGRQGSQTVSKEQTLHRCQCWTQQGGCSIEDY